MVPPLRRLSSIAYGVQLVPSRTTTKSTANRPRAPSSASRAPIVAACVVISWAYCGVGGEDAAQVFLAARSAQELVVRREQLDHAAGQDAELDTGAQQLVALDPLLDDAAPLRELRDVDVVRRLLGLELHLRELSQHRLPLLGRSRLWEAREPYDGIALSRDTLVELDDRTAHGRTRGAHLHDRVGDVVEPVQVFGAQRVRHAQLAEEPPAPGLGPQIGQAGIRRRTSGCPGSAPRRVRARWCCKGRGATWRGWGSVRRSGRAPGDGRAASR